YTFSGWTDANGYSVTSSTKVTNVSNHTLYANWTPKKVTVTLNANGGKVSPSSVEVTFDSTYVGLPTNPTKDYNNFVGWYDENGNVVTSSTKVTNASSHTLYAEWTLKPLSPWMPASSLPNGAKIVEQKWTYTKTETTTSTASSMSGWTQTGSSWRQTGSGTHYYASYPSGFSTSHSLYSKYNKSALTSYENASNKREVSAASQYTYIYWHWTYRDDSYGHDRLIGDKYSPSSTYLQNNIYFHAFETTESASLRSGSTKVYNSTTLSTPPKFGSSKWWYRFSVYKQTYTDYEKLYSYKKVTNGLESATQVYTSDTISNVQHMIRYREK
ncbi:MAG: InlB B-repeat-containing protein, partial [Ruminiclostridium sp.]|nr:InlB B-repeat-containing protein [Ruminiclostridium sp.]